MPATPPARIEHEHGPPLAFTEYSLDIWQTNFLHAYAEVGSIEGAARIAKINSRYHYTWIKENSDYSICYAQAREMYSDVAEGEIRNRGIKGYKKQLSYKGKLTGDETTEFSDALALAVIKALKPEYRDGQQIAVGPAKISIEITNSAGNLQADSSNVIVIPGIELTPQDTEK